MINAHNDLEGRFVRLGLRYLQGERSAVAEELEALIHEAEMAAKQYSDIRRREALAVIGKSVRLMQFSCH